MKNDAVRAIGIAVITALVLGILHWLGVGLTLLLTVGIVIASVCWMLPWLGVRWLDDAILGVRTLYWAREQGHFHSFGGVPLKIEDDGRHIWVAGEGYMRAVGKREPEDVLAARLTGHWQRDEGGLLMLRVDAVVQHLATMPGRDDPRVQRLRRYFEREVLYPAGQRRARGIDAE